MKPATSGLGHWREADRHRGGPAPRGETRRSRCTRIAAALLLAACWGAPPILAAGFQSQQLIPDHLDPGDRFGSALAMGVLRNGDRVVAVGAYLSSVGGRGPESGTVYLFTCPMSGVCSLVVPPLLGATGDWFGFDVAIDGTRLLVGAPRAHDGSGAQTGAAYQFDLSNLPAGPVLAQGPLPVPSGHDGDEIGSAVALSGSDWAVGARGDGHAGIRAGSVYVCCLQGQVQKLIPGPPAAGAQFGQSLSFDGDLLAVGAPLAEPAGAAYVHNRKTAWQGTRLPPPAAVTAGAAFGYAVALSGNQVVVGAPLDDGEAGAAYLYSLAPAQGPQQPLPLPASAGSGAQFGVSVAFDRLKGDILVGARLADGAKGAAYLFSSEGSPLPPPLSSPNPHAGANFGFETAIRDGALVVGAFLQDREAGAAYLFAPVVPPVQEVTVALAAPTIAFPESAGKVLLPVVVATSDGRQTVGPVTVQVEAVTGNPPAGSPFRLLTHQVILTIPAGQFPGLANAKMVQIGFVPDPPCMGGEAFTVKLQLDPKLTQPGVVLGTPSTELVTLHDDLAGLAIGLAHPPPLRTSDNTVDHFTVALCSQPTAAVAIGFVGAAGFGVLTPPSLVFTPADWNQPQTVTVSSVENPGCRGDFTITYLVELTTASADARYAVSLPPHFLTVADQHHDRTLIAASMTVSAACHGAVLFTLVLTNHGDCPLLAGSSTRLVDRLSWEDLSLVAATADRGTVSVDFVANRVAWSGAIPPGAQATIRVDAALQAGVVAGQQVANQAVLTYASRPGGPDDVTLTTSTNFAAFAGCELP